MSRTGPKIARLREFPLPAPVLALDSTPEGQTLIAAGQDGVVSAIDTKTGVVRSLGRHPSYASGVAL